MTINAGTEASGVSNPNHSRTPAPFNGWAERMGMKDYKSQYMHPKWQKRRLEMLESAGYQCQSCEDTEKTLHVHHKRYIKGRDVWDYADDDLEVLCADCHKHEHWQKDELNKMVSSMDSDQVSNLICLVAGMQSYSYEIEDEQLANWETLNKTAVDAGYIAGSLIYDRQHNDAAILSDLYRANPPDHKLYAECYPENEGVSYVVELLKAQGY